MIDSLPPFIERHDYRQLRGGKWRFALRRPVTVRLDFDTGRNLTFFDGSGRAWLTIQRDLLIVHGGYAWNGCSPKWWAFGRWWGTPDPEPTRIASCVHDVLYQFINVPEMPLTRKQADAAFWDLLRLGGHPLKGVYHGAVRKLGGFFAGSKPKHGEHALEH